MLNSNCIAPEFSLYATPDQRLSLSEFRGKKIILAFYPADWSPVCGDQMSLYNEMLPYFKKYNAELIGISVDSKWCHLAFAQDRKLHFPLLSDFEPKGKISNLYDVYNTVEGQSERVLYVIDEQGVIQWNFKSPVGINPGADGILEILQKLNKN